MFYQPDRPESNLSAGLTPPEDAAETITPLANMSQNGKETQLTETSCWHGVKSHAKSLEHLMPEALFDFFKKV
ncbi:hypothetical protein [Rubripirellula reticaptiva]|uniref:hypothetical protein n=1 Tax=Rubripirellula reticaptiva TaxID=2528013 RepID=UPI001C970026|nr:hypothetical protein [Rubripirellula reticaptiva]